MRMVKSALLSGAASLIAVAGAQPADLPVKAKAVEYVKVCSMYGTGFYYIPGTDTCIKIGGYLRFEVDHNAGGTFSPGVSPGGSAAQHIWGFDRTSDTLVTRQRMLWTYDVRTNTEFGTLRSYARTGIQWTTGDSVLAGSGAVAYLDRAFMQFAGFTLGKAVSFYDSYVFGIHSYQSSILGSEGTSGNGTPMIAYTATLGNGILASLALEESYARSKSITNVNGAGYWSVNAQSPFGNGPPSAQAGSSVPDIVGNLRIDQAWGYLSVSAAAHQSKALYYGSAGNTAPGGGDPGLVPNGHPQDKWGWAAQAGGLINLPWSKGDTLGLQVAYGQGALGFVNGSGIGSLVIFHGGTIGLGFMTDAVYGGTNGANGSALELTTAWAVTGGAEHYWTPALRSSLYGGYSKVDYNANATNLICTGIGLAQLGKGAGFSPTNCSPDFAFWQIGSRTIWNPVQNLDLGVEVMYNRLQSGFAGNAIVNANVAQPTQNLAVKDQDVVSAIFRAQRNFWP
jgi:porin-like protein